MGERHGRLKALFHVEQSRFECIYKADGECTVTMQTRAPYTDSGAGEQQGSHSRNLHDIPVALFQQKSFSSVQQSPLSLIAHAIKFSSSKSGIDHVRNILVILRNSRFGAHTRICPICFSL